MVLSLCCHFGKQRPRSGSYHISLDTDFLHRTAELEHDSPVPLVSHQKIAPVTQNKILLLYLIQMEDQLRQFLFRPNHNEAFCLSSYAESSMSAHRFVKQDTLLRNNCFHIIIHRCAQFPSRPFLEFTA